MMTFEEFQASKKVMTWEEAATLLRIDSAWTDCPKTCVYAGHVFIEDYSEEGYEHELQPRGRFVLTLGRDIFYSDELPSLERRLYDYMREDDDDEYNYNISKSEEL